MKKIKRIPVIILSLLILLVIPVHADAKVKTSKKNISIYTGQEITLNIPDVSGKIKWKSSKRSVAAVSTDGIVTGKSRGKAVITAKKGQKTYRFSINVRAAIKSMYTTGVSEKGNIMRPNEKKKINYWVVPSFADDKVLFTSSDPSVAVVSSKGVIKAVNYGCCQIVARAKSTKQVISQIAIFVRTDEQSDSIRQFVPGLDPRIYMLYDMLKISIHKDPSMFVAGNFNPKDRTITLRDTNHVLSLIHELGHLLAFASRKYDLLDSFKEVYDTEKDRYKGFNAKYITSSPSEYFAESFKDYSVNPMLLKENAPLTYAAITDAISRITEESVHHLIYDYLMFWPDF